MLNKRIRTVPILFFLILITSVPIIFSATWNNYIIDGSSSDWSSDELMDTDSGVNLYITWSSTAIYFGLLNIDLDTGRDFFIYISTSLTGGTTQSMDWNVSGSSHTIRDQMHYCFAIENPFGNWSLRKYNPANNIWEQTSFSGSFTYSSLSSSCTEISLPLSDMNISSDTTIHIVAFSQWDGGNGIAESFPVENDIGGPPTTLRYYYQIDKLGNGITPNTSPAQWQLYNLYVSTSSGDTSGPASTTFSPNNDMFEDYVYYRFTSVVGGSCKVIIDTNGDGVFSETEDYYRNDLGSVSEDTEKGGESSGWDGKKTYSSGGSGQTIIAGNGLHRIYISVTDGYGNIAVDSVTLSASPLTGWVSGQANVPYLYIEAKSSSQWSWGMMENRWAVCSSTGYYELYGLKDGQYDLKASSTPYASGFSTNVVVSGTSGNFGSNFTLTWGAQIWGYVTDFLTGNPMSNVTIESTQMSGNSTTNRYEQIQTDGNGYYTDQCNFYNNYRIQASKSSMGSDTIPYATKTSTVTALTEGTTTQINFVMTKSGVIIGSVTFQSSGINNCKVNWYDNELDYYNESQWSSSYVTTNSSGEYRIPDGGSPLSPGVYTIAFDPPDNLSIAMTHINNVAVHENESVILNIELADGAALTGLVTVEGAPLTDNNATVSLYWTKNDLAVEEQNTQILGPSSGTYAFYNLEPSTWAYYIRANRSGMNTASEVSPINISTSIPNIQDFYLSAASSVISGTITNYAGFPADQIYYVMAIASGAETGTNGMPDFMCQTTSGQYTLGVDTNNPVYNLFLLPVGENDSPSAIATVLYDVYIPSSTADMVIHKGFSITGKVTRTDTGEEIYGPTVNLCQLIDGTTYLINETLNKDDSTSGDYEITYVSTGTYDIKCSQTGYLDKWLYDVTVDSTTAGTDSVLPDIDFQLVPDPSTDNENPTITYIAPGLNTKICCNYSLNRV